MSTDWLTRKGRSLGEALGDKPDKPLRKRGPSFEETMVAAVRQAHEERAKGRGNVAPTQPETTGTGENLIEQTKRLLAAGSTRGFERLKRETFEARRHTRVRPDELGKPRSTREEKVEKFRAWAVTLSPEQRDAYLSSEQYLYLPDRGKDIVDEALGVIELDELEPPTPEEVEAMNNYVDYGNEAGFQDYGEDEDDE
jgi:hypothetical protein